MVYIAPPQQNRPPKRQQQPAAAAGKAPRAKPDQQDAGKPARGKNAKQGRLQSLDAVQSKQDLLEELTRQAEWHTVVLQREQAALRALQESKAASYGTHSSQGPPGRGPLSDPAKPGYDSSSIGTPGGLKPVVVKPNNHIFLNVAPRVVDPSNVPGLGGPAAPATKQQTQALQQQQPAARGLPAPGRQQGKQQQQQQSAGQQQGSKPAVNNRNAAAKQQQQQQPGRNAQQQQKQQPLTKGKAQNQRAAAAPAVHDDDDDDDEGASPFAEADWKYDFPTEGGAPQAAPGMHAGHHPGGGNFRTGQEFEIPQGDDAGAAGQYQAGLAGGRAGAAQAGRVPVSVGDYALIGGTPAQQRQQQQQPPGWQQLRQQQPPGWQQQQQPYQQHQQQPVIKSLADELADQLQEAQAHPNPAVRQRLIKEIRQKQYKLELEQQIADREAARQAARAAAAAKEAEEEARRAAAPPPWDPAVKAGRRGGGGEPLKDAAGVPVANLRAMKSQHALHAEPSQPQSVGSQQQPYQPQLPSGPSQGQLHAAGPAGGLQQSASAADVGAATARGPKGFMGALSELKPGLSQEQQHAAAEARQQLLADLEAQIADKQARAAAQAAADAAKAAQEEEALRRYYAQQQQQQLPAMNSISSPQGVQGGLAGEASRGLGFAGNSAGALGSSAYAAAAASRKGRAKHVIEAPWLDQAQQQQQLQQRPPGQTGLQKEASACNAGVFSPPGAAASPMDLGIAPGNHLQQQRSAQRQLGVAGNADSQQLAAALQELQEEQQVMWQEFTKQQQALEQLMQDKRSVAEEAHAAKAELERLRGALEQQQLLQQDCEGQQQQQQRSRQQQGPRQQRDAVQQQQQLEVSASMQGDALDAFVVETHLVPLSINSLQENDSFMQLVAAQPAVAGNSTLRQSQPVLTARQHLSRYNSAYGPEAEASNISIASQAQPGSTRASWGAWPRPAQGQRPPPSPPILRSDKFVDKQPQPAAPMASSTNKKGGGKVSRMPGGGKSKSPVGANKSPARKRS